MPTVHVVLVTYGEPPQPSFGSQLAYSWRILVGLTRTIAPIPKLLLPVIATVRARTRTRSWTEEGYSSPLEPITARQAAGLTRVLDARDPSRTWDVRVAYEFRRPLLDETLAELPPGDRVCVLPMYAADSAFTHALSRDVVASGAAQRHRVHVLGALEPDVLAELSTAHVLEHAHAAGAGWTGHEVALVLAAHGTVLDPPRPIDTGYEATERLRQEIEDRLGPAFGLVVNGWLNHTRGGRWTEPPIEEALRSVKDAGFTRVVYFPFGFLADNAETQLEGRVALRGQPDLEALHLPCLNAAPSLLDALADQVLAVVDSAPPARDARRSAPERVPVPNAGSR